MSRLRRLAARLTGRARREPVPILLAVMAYVPILLTNPGRVSADTKSYLTLDPARLLSRAVNMWDPAVGAGTVTHQNIGFLFPLGPYYWLIDRLGVPDWVAQRLLWGTLVFAAAAGTWRLLRWLGWAGGPAAVAAIAYGWSPYLFSYLARLSVILGPWAAMPWLILFAARAVRAGGWRLPACFAATVAVVGSSNATSLVLVLVAPALWVVVDLFERRVTWHAVLAAGWRTATLTVLVSLWWVAGLRIQGMYGIPILRYTETYQTVALASTPAELLRGLGYWFFYGGDKLDPWVGPSTPYLSNAALMTLGFTLAGLSLLGLFAACRGRRNAAALVLVGLAVAAGAAPWPGGSLYGRLFRQLSDTTPGMALRSTPRAAPLVVLGLAMGLGAAAGWVASRWRRPRAVYAAAAALVVAQAFPWFTLRSLTPSLLRDETLPGYERQLAHWLDSTGTARVWEVPGSDFANYRWGGTVDPVLPGIIDRPYLARELVPQGGPATANLLNAIDRRMHEGWFEPESLAPVARLLGVGTVVARHDLEYERYALARPWQLDADLRVAIGQPAFQGPVLADAPRVDMSDPISYAAPGGGRTYPAVAAYQLDPSEPVLTIEDATRPILLAGDGEGVVDAAAAGLLDGTRPLVYAAADPVVTARLARKAGTWIVVTDTNRKQGQRWSAVSSNRGALEAAGSSPVADDRDNPLDVFPRQTDADRTVLVPEGDLSSVWASGYGNRFTYTPEDAAAFAVDGDPSTAWRGATFEASDGLSLHLGLRRPVHPDHVTLIQPLRGVTDRFIVSARLTLTNGSAEPVVVYVALNDQSRTATGQRVDLPPGTTFTDLRFEVIEDNFGSLSSYAGMPGVGLAELAIPGVKMATTVALPTDVLATAGELAGRRLTVLMTRQRIAPGTVNRFDPEPTLRRALRLSQAVDLQLTGTARLAGSATDRAIDELLGGGPVTATVNRRTDGAPNLGARAALDGDLSTAWTTPLGGAVADPSNGPVGSEITVTTGQVQGGRRWRLLQATGPAYSPITAMSIRLADGSWTPLPLPTGDPVVTMPSGTGSSFTVRIDAVDARVTREYFSGVVQTLPAGIVELTPVEPDPTPRSPGVLGVCRDDLVEVDGRPVSVRLRGTAADLLARRGLAIEACDGAVLHLGIGVHTITSAPGATTALDIDRVVLNTAGAAAAGDQHIAAGGGVDVGAPTVTHADATGISATLPASPTDRYLVLRQSWNAGWELSIDGASAGAPELVDGYANGWLIPAGGPHQVSLRWSPQRQVDIALVVSVVAMLVTVVLVVAGRRRPDGEWRSAPAPRPRVRGAATVALIAGSFVLGGWGALAGAAAAVVIAHRWKPVAAPLITTVAGALAAGYVVASQLFRSFPAGAAWPDHFRVVTPLVWFAVTLATTSALRGDAVASPSPPATPGGPLPPTPS